MFTRDVPGLSHAGRRRRVGQLTKRMGVAKIRLRRACGLVKSCRRARKLIRASPYAVGLWGVGE